MFGSPQGSVVLSSQLEYEYDPEGNTIKPSLFVTQPYASTPLQVKAIEFN